MDVESSSQIMLAFVKHDYIPDILRGIAFRRSGRTENKRRKAIKCPHCAKQLTAVDSTTKVELYKYSKSTDVSCHEYRKCSSCSETIGIIFALG